MLPLSVVVNTKLWDYFKVLKLRRVLILRFIKFPRSWRVVLARAITAIEFRIRNFIDIMEISAYMIFTAICFKSDKTCRLRFRDIARRVTPKQRCASPLGRVTIFYSAPRVAGNKAENETNEIISYSRLSSKDRRENWKAFLTSNVKYYVRIRSER